MIEPAYRYRAYAERVHDGDTYQLRIDLGFDVAISVMGRLHGVDCPELNTQPGKAARDYVAALLRPTNLRWDDRDARPRELIVESYKDRRSFARWVVDVYLLEDGKSASLAELLVAAGMGRPFMA